MAKFALLVFLSAFAFSNGQDGQNVAPSMQGLKIFCDTESKFNFLIKHNGKPGFDFLRISRAKNVPIEVLVDKDKLLDFKFNLTSRNIRYEIFVEDVGKVIEEELALQKSARAAHQDEFLNLKAFPRYDEIIKYFNYLATSYKGIVEVFSIGKTFEERDIIGLKISSGGSGKPALLIDAGIHAREWIAPTTALYAVKQLAENASNKYIFENIDIYVIPSLNPDGYEYTHKSSETRMWRKTRSINPNSRCIGADPNRNFDFEWNTVGASTNPCSEIYAGSKPFSEPETAALRDFVLAHEGQIRAYITFHSYGNDQMKWNPYLFRGHFLSIVQTNYSPTRYLWDHFEMIITSCSLRNSHYFLHPWGYTSDLPENEPTLRCVAEKSADALSQLRGTQYAIGSSTNVLYAAAGGSDDWTMAVGKAELSYTIELPGGRYGFAPPPSEIIPVGQETFEAIKVVAQYVDDGVCNREK